MLAAVVALVIAVVAGATVPFWKIIHGSVEPWTDVMLALSSSIGTVGLLGTLWVGYLELRRLREEQDQRLRAWLSLGDPHFMGLNPGGNKILPFNELFDESGLKVKTSAGKLIVTFPVRNVGALPAYRITNAIVFGITTLDDIRSQKICPNEDVRGVLFPGEGYEMQLDVPYEKFVIAHETDRAFRFRARLLYQGRGKQQRWTERIWAYKFPSLRDKAGETDESRPGS